MIVSASLVKELRERSGAGMMECKKALVDAAGDIEAAQELLRTRGQAKADKKAGRVAAEGQIVTAASPGGEAVVLLEVNCETDFVARDPGFQEFADAAAKVAASNQPQTVEALMALPAAGDSGSLEERRRALIARIGENITVRRFRYLRPEGRIGSYFHGTRIGVLVDVQGGDDELRKDLAMHIAAANPRVVAPDEVPESEQASERRILAEQARQEGKPPEIVAKMVEGRLRKFLNEVALLGQPFVKDPDLTVGNLLQQKGARVIRFARLEVGEGIEKKSENIAEAVAAMHSQG